MTSAKKAKRKIDEERRDRRRAKLKAEPEEKPYDGRYSRPIKIF